MSTGMFQIICKYFRHLQRLDDGNTFIFWGPAIDHSKQFIDDLIKQEI